MQRLPCERTNAELVRLHDEHVRAGGQPLDLGAAEINVVLEGGGYYLLVGWPRGPYWVVPTDPETNAYLQARDRTKH